ncbi:phosphoenolpyruvate synthase [Patescibacteria group bacterium]|nr:phosphoenolpyruvate synthase [Patescibacteria group bacterium]
MAQKSFFVLGFDEIDKDDTDIAGVNGAMLGEMTRAGFIIPDGFVVDTRAYFNYIRRNKLAQKISDLLSTAHFERADSLGQVSSHIKKLFMHGSMQEELVKEIYFAYRKLSGIFKDAKVEVYSSPTNGIAAYRHEGFLPRPAQDCDDMRCKGEANLILKIRESWASFFEPGALLYRHERKLDHFRYCMAVVVQRVVPISCRGIIFTVDPISNDKTKIIIEEIFATKKINTHEVRKADLEIINTFQGSKRKLTNNQVLELARLAKKIERYYYFPQEVEWVIEKNKIYILRTGPITGFIGVGSKTNGIASPSLLAMTDSVKPSEKLQLLLSGVGVSPGIVKGKVRIVTNEWHVNKIEKGEILVATQTNQSYIGAMKKAAGIITDHGGRTSHAAIVSRELGIPCVVGTGDATNALKKESIVTINGLSGEIYRGFAEHSAKQNFLKTATKIYVDLNQTGLAAKVAEKNINGVIVHGGEFMKSDIGVHPEKLLKDRRGSIYSERLADHIRVFSEKFAPRPVIYRISDFKANEYGKLVGGKDHENVEPNPCLGYRGSFRHIRDREAFELELNAVRIVRQQMGYNNLYIMVPFCRTVKELVEMKKIISFEKLHRSLTFKIWMAIEVPSNVILIDKFIEAGIDGVSIGLDNLTMLMLGNDFQNNEVSQGFDEKDPAVLWALERVIKACHKHHVTSSIYTKSSSIKIDLFEKLVDWGITSVLVTPDVIDSTRERIFDIERRLIIGQSHGKN